MAKVIMVQGTMSGAGKSLLVAGLCRIFMRAGYRAAPFKSQNMALNSFVTEEGLEMGRAQVMQAEAAGIAPDVCMNPILLKPTDDTGSQVIVNGTVFANMDARDYFAYKKNLIPDIKKAFLKLEELADIIVIEGAGSPAEINLKEQDIVNMGLAKLVDAPVLLVGDIDRGGVFAQLLGTLLLLEEDEKSRVKGLLINKFRGDRTLLHSGIEILEEKGKIPVVGVIPYMDISMEDEDSLTERFEKKAEGKIDLAVIRYPRISNFTDFNVFEQIESVTVRYVASAKELGKPDLLFLPGSKNTIKDLKWMRKNGLEAAIKGLAGKVPVCGICGGYQMMGQQIFDTEHVEAGGCMKGMGLLPVITRLQSEKVRRRVHGMIGETDGILSVLSGLSYEGYEIHMGRTVMADSRVHAKQEAFEEKYVKFCGEAPVIMCGDLENTYGTYVHGIFDKGFIAAAVVGALAARKGIVFDSAQLETYAQFKERQYDKLADTLMEYLNMEEIYGMLRESHLE